MRSLDWPLVLLVIVVAPVRAEINLIAVGQVSGNAVDGSMLTDTLGEGTPHNRLGGFGSAITHVRGNRFLFLPDRGPKDGASTYQCRLHTADLKIIGQKIQFDLKESVILKTPDGQPYLGDQTNLLRRLDPEGARVSPAGRVYVSDEYGPKILEFDRQGKQIRELLIPKRFLIDRPSGDPKQEFQGHRGRTPNRGFEGLALTPLGKLVAILQSPLLQEGGRDGLNVRLLELDPATSKTREFIYPLENTNNGISDILAISDTDFLVLERDGDNGMDRFCKIFRVSILMASDISSSEQIPIAGLAKGMTPVTKVMFLDLTKFGLSLPEKVEGICFGPNLALGRHLLLVATDNDFQADQATEIYGFSVDTKDLQ